MMAAAPAMIGSLGWLTGRLLKELVWVAAGAALFIVFGMIANVAMVDFMRFNPHRSAQHAAGMIVAFAPLAAIIAAIGTALVFPLAQWLQALAVYGVLQAMGRRHLYLATLSIPAAAALSWYCYDYLTPSDLNLGFNEGADWQPYRHGMTLARYLNMLAVQAAVSVFCLLRLRQQLAGQSGKAVLLAGLLLAAAAGAVSGVRMTA